MDPQLLTAIICVGLVLMILGCSLVLRDILNYRKQQFVRRVGKQPPPQLRLEEERSSGRGLTGWIDRAIEGLVLESGSDWSPSVAFLLMVLCGVLAGSIVLIALDHVPGSMLATLLGFAIPVVYFQYRRVQHQKQLAEQLPRALDLLTRGVRAGETVDSAFSLVGEAAPEPIAGEFRRASRKLSLGLTINSVMNGMARRIRTPEIRILRSALAVQRQTGGNIAVALERLAQVVRDRQSYRRQFRAATAGGRLGAILTALCGPAYIMFMLFSQAEYTAPLFADARGLGLLVLAIVLQVIGLLWIWRMMKTEY